MAKDFRKAGSLSIPERYMDLLSRAPAVPGLSHRFSSARATTRLSFRENDHEQQSFFIGVAALGLAAFASAAYANRVKVARRALPHLDSRAALMTMAPKLALFSMAFDTTRC